MAAAADTEPAAGAGNALGVHDLPRALATRARRRPGDPVVPFEFGVFDSQGQVEGFALLRREWPKSKTCNPTGEPVPATVHLTGTYVYGGVLIDQWGHFILETLSRAWFWRDCGAPLVLHCERPALAPWQSALLDALGRPRGTIHLIDRPTSFDRLLVPQAGYVISSFFHETQALALGLRPWRPVAGRRVWISRSRLGERALGTFANEEQVEEALAGAGWVIAHPQQLDVEAQIRLFAEAEHVAGIEGSALHSLLLVHGFRGRVSIVPRKQGGRLNSRNYALISQVCGFPQWVYPGPIRVLSGNGAFGRLELADHPDCLRFLTRDEPW